MTIKSTDDAFNPGVKDVQLPSYLGLSDSIKQYETTSGLGIALKGVGQFIEKAANAADELVKNDAAENVERTFEPMRDEYTRALKSATEYAQNATKPQPTTDATSTISEGGSPGGMPVQAADIPPEQRMENMNLEQAPAAIKALPGQLDALGSARADGKISETDFQGRLAAKLKDVRSAYPIAYRPYVDSLVSQKFGGSPANAYIAGMIKDINAALTNAQHEKTATLAFIRSHIGEDGAPTIYNALEAGNITPGEAMSRIAVPLRQKTRIERAHAELNLDKADFEFKGQAYERTANEIANATVDKAMSSIISANGFNGQRLQQIIDDFNSGNLKLKGTQGLELAKQTQVLIDKAKAEMDENFNRPNKWGPISSVVAGEKLNGIKDAQLEKLIRIRNGFFKGDLSMVADSANFAKSAADDSKYQLLQNPQINKGLLLMDNLKSLGVSDTLVGKLAERMITGGEFMKEWNDYTRAQVTDLITPSSTTKSWDTLKQAITDQNYQQKKWNLPVPQTYHALSSIVDGTNISLANAELGPNTKAIHNQILTTVFGPGNENVLKLIKSDTRDEKGNVIPGAQSWFFRFTDPKVVGNIHKEFGEGSPQEKMYLDWIDKTVNEDLLRVDLANLKKYNLANPGTNWRLLWNTESKNFDLEVNGNVMTGAGLRQAYTRGGAYGTGVQAATYVQNVNKVLTGLRRVAEGTGKTGDQVDAYVLRPLLNSVGMEQMASVPGIPSSLATSIRNAYLKQQIESANAKSKMEEQGRKNRGSFGNPEDKAGF